MIRLQEAGESELGGRIWIETCSAACRRSFFGTFWLVFGGCGSAVLAAAFPQLGIGFMGVALAFGLTVLTMAYAVGHISGRPFQPGRHGRARGRRAAAPTST